MTVKSFIKASLNKVFEDYRINWIMSSGDASPSVSTDNGLSHPQPLTSIHHDMLLQSETETMRKSVSYGKKHMQGFALVENGKPVCAAHFADAFSYSRTPTWPLAPNQVALMDIATEESFRGRGLAVTMIKATTVAYLAEGKDAVIAFIWWSNTASIRAFTKAGWKKTGLSLEFCIGGRWRSLHLPYFG